MTILIGAHVELADPFLGGELRGAEVLQVNLSAPRTWKAPVARVNANAWLESDVPIYAHAPYLINSAAINPDVRAKSRVALMGQQIAAAALGVKGIVVHAGHPTGSGSIEDACQGWVEVLRGLEIKVPILIENTAGGHAGPGRTPETLGLLWDALAKADLLEGVGFTLDTCHAWAAGVDLVVCVDRFRAVVGEIALVHANDSKDGFASGRDRHENLGKGEIGVDLIAHVVREAGVHTVVETPGGVDGQKVDVELLTACVSIR